MAVTSALVSSKASFVLSQGTDPVTHKAINKNISIGPLVEDPASAANGAMVYGVVDALSPIMNGTVGLVTTTEKRALEKV